MDRGPRRTFPFTVRYFKETGKWYTDTVYHYECACLDGQDDQPYMNDVVAHLRGLRDAQAGLPGLQSGTWSGFIMVQHGNSFPTLILAKPMGDDE